MSSAKAVRSLDQLLHTVLETGRLPSTYLQKSRKTVTKTGSSQHKLAEPHPSCRHCTTIHVVAVASQFTYHTTGLPSTACPLNLHTHAAMNSKRQRSSSTSSSSLLRRRGRSRAAAGSKARAPKQTKDHAAAVQRGASQRLRGSTTTPQGFLPLHAPDGSVFIDLIVFHDQTSASGPELLVQLRRE